MKKFVSLLKTNDFEIRQFAVNRFVVIYPFLSFCGRISEGVRRFESIDEVRKFIADLKNVVIHKDNRKFISKEVEAAYKAKLQQV